jgi:hypothetical protein
MRGTAIEILADLQTAFAEIIPCYPEILVGNQEIALKQVMAASFQALPNHS